MKFSGENATFAKPETVKLFAPTICGMPLRGARYLEAMFYLPLLGKLYLNPT